MQIQKRQAFSKASKISAAVFLVFFVCGLIAVTRDSTYNSNTNLADFYESIPEG